VSSGTIVLIDAACLYQSNVYSFIRSFGIHRHSLSIVVFGEPNDHKNQRHVITGAMDYISQGMLTAPDFKEYLQTRIERHWQPLSALS
ncbi:MAG: hypothetical protein RL226_88, partial [Bacteroidota bacterium]